MIMKTISILIVLNDNDNDNDIDTDSVKNGNDSDNDGENDIDTDGVSDNNNDNYMSWASQDPVYSGDRPCSAQFYAVGHGILTRCCSCTNRDVSCRVIFFTFVREI